MRSKDLETDNQTLNGTLAVTADTGLESRAISLAEHLGVRYLEEIPEERVLRLHWGVSGLMLTDGELELTGDFDRMLRRLKQSNLQNEFLVKAARIKGAQMPLTLVDATAGLGEDSLLLAAAGFQVKLYEYDPVIAALLRDALERAAEDPLLGPIAARMELHEEDSVTALPLLAENPPDVVLLDPMFPERQKSASVKKKFQLLQQLERPCSEERELLEAALQANPRRVVIKRPAKGPWLAGVKPDYSLSGKAIRYDCFVRAREK